MKIRQSNLIITSAPEELKDAIVEFVDYYNNNRYHESLNNVTPADVHYGREEEV